MAAKKSKLNPETLEKEAKVLENEARRLYV
jgi:hypothetical protein